MFRLKENTFFYNKDKKTVIIHGTHKYSINDPKSDYFKMLKSENYSNELKQFLINKNIVNNWDETEINRLDRTGFYFLDVAKSTINSFDKFKEVFSDTTIIIIGCGGIGTVVLDNLIRCGFTNFVLVDNDKIEKSNLNRQLFFTLKDVGSLKTNTLKNTLSHYTDNKLHIQTCCKYIHNVTDLKRIIHVSGKQLIVNCADSPEDIINVVGDYGVQENIPFCYAYVGIETGTISPIYDKTNVFSKQKIESNGKIKGSIGSTNMIVGSLLSHKIISYLMRKFISGDLELLFKKQIINFNTFEVDTYE